ncbi:hypothetical protein ACHAW6_008045 [Cyclotella cf. meneghiniana]
MDSESGLIRCSSPSPHHNHHTSKTHLNLKTLLPHSLFPLVPASSPATLNQCTQTSPLNPPSNTSPHTFTPYMANHSSTTTLPPLIDAIKIVFRNNVIQVGDTYWRQISGTGMGISPDPPWVTIFYALHKNTFLPLWSHHVTFYK